MTGTVFAAHSRKVNRRPYKSRCALTLLSFMYHLHHIIPHSRKQGLQWMFVEQNICNMFVITQNSILHCVQNKHLCMHLFEINKLRWYTSIDSIATCPCWATCLWGPLYSPVRSAGGTAPSLVDCNCMFQNNAAGRSSTVGQHTLHFFEPSGKAAGKE